MDLRGFEHAAFTVLFARELAGVGAEDRNAVGDELRDVALRGGVLPHLPVHRGRHEQRTLAGEAQRRQQVVGGAVRSLRMKSAVAGATTIASAPREIAM